MSPAQQVPPLVLFFLLFSTVGIRLNRNAYFNISKVGFTSLTVFSLFFNSAVSKSTWLQHLGDKFHEVLQVNAKSLQGVSDSMPITTDGYGGPTPALNVCIY